MRRLYLQIYLTVVGILVLFALLASLAWLVSPNTPRENRLNEQITGVLAEILPGPEAPRAELEAELERLGRRFRSDVAVFDARGTLLGGHGEPVPMPRTLRPGVAGWHYTRRGPTISLPLPDGRWVVARHVHQHDPWSFGWLAMLALLAVAVGLGAYPVVRRITGRLERLQARVDALGAGDLSARVKVEGGDEVAELARSFNHAADRIEQLVNAQKTLLASASHELRSPLARMRVAIELLTGEERPEIRDQVSHDIAELDDLIGELLLASRLDTLESLERREQIDLLALLAEEAARCEATVSGELVRLHGDRRMLRRLLRNLFDNARRYGAGSEIEASVVARTDGGARIRVEDRGPGVPEAERERIFEPFYRPPGTAETTEGVGLGLALVRQIARHHGGDARCLAREGRGTRFEVELS